MTTASASIYTNFISEIREALPPTTPPVTEPLKIPFTIERYDQLVQENALHTHHLPFVPICITTFMNSYHDAGNGKLVSLAELTKYVYQIEPSCKEFELTGEELYKALGSDFLQQNLNLITDSSNYVLPHEILDACTSPLECITVLYPSQSAADKIRTALDMLFGTAISPLFFADTPHSKFTGFTLTTKTLKINLLFATLPPPIFSASTSLSITCNAQDTTAIQIDRGMRIQWLTDTLLKLLTLMPNADQPLKMVVYHLLDGCMPTQSVYAHLETSQNLSSDAVYVYNKMRDNKAKALFILCHLLGKIGCPIDTLIPYIHNVNEELVTCPCPCACPCPKSSICTA